MLLQRCRRFDKITSLKTIINNKTFPFTSFHSDLHQSSSHSHPALSQVTLRCISTSAPSLTPSSTTHNESKIQKVTTETIDTNLQCHKNHNKSQKINYISAFAELSKLKLSALVVSTTSAGFLAAGGPISYPTLAACTLGTALCSSSASTFNQIFEISRDFKMKRTRYRPLPQNIFTTTQAAILGLSTGLSGGTLLFYGIPDNGTITACLGVGNIALYSGLYTYLKPRSEWNTWVGALVGAIPPVMGWTAAGGSIFDSEALLLGGTLFLWQFPHFFALNWMHRIDYARGGFQMVAVNDTNGDRTSNLIVQYTYLLSLMPFLSTLFDVTSSMFAIEGLLFNGYAIHVAHKFHKDRTNQNARKVFFTSLWYLPSFMTLFILHSKTWRDEERIVQNGDLRVLLKEKIKFIRDKGKDLCLHENITHRDNGKQGLTKDQNDQSKLNCPVVYGKEKANFAKKSTDTVVTTVTTLDKTKKSI